MTEIAARPAVSRQSLHPAISADQISDLVDLFYERVLEHERLGSIFSSHINGNWDAHLSKMKSFWRSVLLRSGEYKGKPVPVHLRIDEIDTQAFQDWLDLFSVTAFEIFSNDAAAVTVDAAERIATSLWLSRTPDPAVNPPVWARSVPHRQIRTAGQLQRSKDRI